MPNTFPLNYLHKRNHIIQHKIRSYNFSSGNVPPITNYIPISKTEFSGSFYGYDFI
jgi:hypothetical protein